MKLKIKKAEHKPFQGDEGDKIDYYWYRALRADGISIRFGSTEEYEEGKDIDIDLEEVTYSTGRKGLKEVL